MVLIFESFVCRVGAQLFPVLSYFNVLGYVMLFATDIIGWPIKALWGLIL